MRRKKTKFSHKLNNYDIFNLQFRNSENFQDENSSQVTICPLTIQKRPSHVSWEKWPLENTGILRKMDESSSGYRPG